MCVMCSFANTPFAAANKLNENDASVSELKSNIFAERFDEIDVNLLMV